VFGHVEKDSQHFRKSLNTLENRVKVKGDIIDSVCLEIYGELRQQVFPDFFHLLVAVFIKDGQEQHEDEDSDVTEDGPTAG
jgi:hypothetical protein